MRPPPDLPPPLSTCRPNQMSVLFFFFFLVFCREKYNGFFSMKAVHYIPDMLGHFVMQITIECFLYLSREIAIVHCSMWHYSNFYG